MIIVSWCKYMLGMTDQSNNTSFKFEIVVVASVLSTAVEAAAAPAVQQKTHVSLRFVTFPSQRRMISSIAGTWCALLLLLPFYHRLLYSSL